MVLRQWIGTNGGLAVMFCDGVSDWEIRKIANYVTQVLPPVHLMK